METSLTTGKPEIVTDFSGNISIIFRVEKESAPAARALANKLHGMKDKLILTIKEYRNRRSLSANGYMWKLLSEIAQAIGSDKDAVYLEMLRRYGKFTYAIVNPAAAEELKRRWRTADELEEVTVNGKRGVQLRLYYGSSTYDTKEMSVLLDGIVSECRELGIEPDTKMKVLLSDGSNYFAE